MTFNKPFLTNILVLSGLLFTTARMVRGTDNLYILALLSFLGMWALNYKIIWDSKFQRITIWFLPFGIWAVLSTIWSLEPLESLSRGIFYIFISCTAVLIGFIYKKRLKELFTIFTILNVVFIVASFLSLVSGIPSDAWTANHGLGFTSIFTHQNTLAAVLMFTLVGPIYFLLNPFAKEACHSEEQSNEESLELEKNKLKIKNKSVISNPFSVRTELASSPKVNLFQNKESIFSFLLVLSNLNFIYLSYSRAVMLALFVGGLAFIYLLGTLKFNLIFTFALVITFGSIYYFFQEDVTKYLKKSAPDYLGRRMILWEPSYQAAINGGFFGLGYGVTDPTIESNYKKENKFGELKREKGNSILALIEETGLVGLILFCMPVFFVFASYRNYNFSINHSSINNNHSSLHRFTTSVFYHFDLTQCMLLPFSFLIGFLVHAQFEAWWTGISNVGLFIFLILLSVQFTIANKKLSDFMNTM